MNMKTAS